MTKKGGGAPTERYDEEPWQPPGAEEPLQRSLDLALQREDDDGDEEEPEFIYGDIVHDDEADEPIALVVVNVPGLEADEWEFGDGDTLADKIPKYPDDDFVVVVVPLDVLEDYLPNWDEREVPIDIEQLVEDKIPFAPFPSLQLVRVEDSHLRDD
ncbi:hypothetical protein ACFR97_16300 [Haloplanus litoreus]|uniref:Uncharacterized protein n=1 Tax=Haloplanus litoreus TaxID=767515 RepID=A0ABD6A3Y1_9EURY